jgi:phenylacetate-CoA ligase
MPVLEAEQWLAPAEVCDRQLTRAREAVRRAYARFGFYRRKLEASGFARTTVDTPFDWSRVPPLRRSEISASAGFVPAARAYAWRSTGGSTGPALRIPLDRNAYCWYMGGQWRGLQWWGLDIGDRGAVLLPSGGRGRIRALARLVKDWALNWLPLPADAAFDQHADAVLARVEAFRPAFIYGYPSVLARLAQHRLRRPPARWPGPRLVVTAGEHLYGFQRRLIEHAFGSPIAEEYGCSEVGSIAFQCPEGTLHVTAESVLVEAAQAAEAGSVLITGLRNPLIPLIRYELGDWVVRDTETCRCGRGLPSVRVFGRVDEQLSIGGERVPAQVVIDRLLAAVEGADHLASARIVERAASALVLQVERQELSHIDARDVADAGRRLRYPIVVEATPRIPRTSLGKIRTLVREPG